jgi:hypothetical protein
LGALPASRDGRVVSTTRVSGGIGNEWVEYTTFAFWTVQPRGPYTVRTGQSLSLSVLACLQERETANSDEDFLPALPLPDAQLPSDARCQPSIREGTWFVNNVRGGNSTVGFVAAGGNGAPSSVAEFLAPNTAPTPNEVKVRADMFWRARGLTKQFEVPVRILVGGFETYRPSGYAKVSPANRCVSAIQPDSFPIPQGLDNVLRIDRNTATWWGGASAHPPNFAFTYFDTCARHNSQLEISVFPILVSPASGAGALPARGSLGPEPVYRGTFSFTEE